MMLYYDHRCTTATTVNYSSNTAASTTTATGNNWCQCPNCGSYHECGEPFEYVNVARTWFDEEEPPEVPEVAQWPIPTSDRRPNYSVIASRQHQARGRELRHRGGFRNFHKMRD